MTSPNTATDVSSRNFVNSPIIFLHGWGMNSQIWTDAISVLPAEMKLNVTCLDLPGYAGQQADVNNYDLEYLVEWLDDKIAEPSIILGWSLGGLVAQAFASKYPYKIRRLLLVATTPKFMQETNWPGIKPEVLELFASQLQKNHAQVIERFMAIQAMGSQTARQDIKTLKDKVLSQPLPNALVLAAGLTILQTVDLREELKRNKVDTRFLFGRLDSLVPVEIANTLLELNSQISSTVLPHASHAPFISHQLEFSEWLELNLLQD